MLGAIIGVLRAGLRLPRGDPARVRGILWRTGTLLAAACLLLVLSRNNVPGPAIAAVSAVYVAAATLWVRGQYAASLTANGLWTPHPLLSLALVAAAATTLVVGWSRSIGFMVIGGLVALFFSLGYLAMGLRQEDQHPDNPAWDRTVDWVGGLVGVAPAPAAVGVNAYTRWFRGSVFRWVIVLAVLVVVASIGLVLGTSSQGALVLLVAAILTLPIPVSVLTSRLNQHLVRSGLPGWRSWKAGATTAGIALSLGGTLLAMCQVAADAWMLAAIGVLALLVIALVSSTYADIIALVAIVAALGVTPQQQSEDTIKSAKGKTSVLVAFGDSYMSGEGAQVFHEKTETTGNHCRRAPTAFAEMAGQLAPFDGFISFACSGARTYNVNHDPDTTDEMYPIEQYPGIRTQLDAYDIAQGTDPENPVFTPRLVLVGLGGNDAGFATIGAMCLAPGNCGGGDENDRDKHPEEDDGDGEDLLMPNLALVEEQLRITFDELSDEFEGVPVAVVGYPDVVYSPQRQGPEDGEPDPATDSGAIPDASAGAAETAESTSAPGEIPDGEDADPKPADCTGVPLSDDDIDFIEDFLVDLNDAVQAAAVDAGFYYVEEMEGALADAHLQLCDPLNDGRAGLNVIGLRSVPGEANERFNPKHWYHNSLHPNEAGHAAMLYAFERWISTHSNGSPPAEIEDHPRGQAVAGTDSTAVTQARAAAACQLYEPAKVPSEAKADDTDYTLATCESAGYRWALGEVRAALTVGGWWGSVFLIIIAGFWFLAVTFFAWRKRAA